MPSAGALSPENLARQSEIVGLTRNGFQEMGNGESYSTTILMDIGLGFYNRPSMPELERLSCQHYCSAAWKSHGRIGDTFLHTNKSSRN